MPLITQMVLVLTFCCSMMAAGADSGGYLLSQYGQETDIGANLRVEMIGQRLARAAGLRDVHFTVFRSGTLNAMAFPDGHVYVTSGMALNASDAELAFVLGHEMTHVKQHHSVEQAVNTALGTLAVGAVAGVATQQARYARLGAALSAGVLFGAFSRRDENRADRYGIHFMAQAGYDPLHALNAMQTLINLYGDGPAVKPLIGLYADHPPSRQRKARMVDTVTALRAHPDPVLPAPIMIEIGMDDTGTHDRAWLPSYCALQLVRHGAGNVWPRPTPGTILSGVRPGDTPVLWPTTPDYLITLTVRQTPAGGATALNPEEGTAVEAILRWTQSATRRTGVITAVAQTHRRIPHFIDEEIDVHPVLADRRSPNAEGSLEAISIRRVTQAFTELILAGEPVRHATVLPISLDTRGLRPNDYVIISRHKQPIAEVRVVKIDSPHHFTGAVLWGTDTWGHGAHLAPQTE